MSDLIFGTGVSFCKEPAVAKEVILSALDNGIRRFDTAPSYETEALLGTALHKGIIEKGISREKICIQTKIDAWQMQNGGIDGFIATALKNLQVEYLDSLLIHWPVPEYTENTWFQINEAKKKGLVKKAGICNVRMRQLKKYISLKPDIIQIERHPLNTFTQEVSFCKENGIEIQSYSPLCKMDNRIKNSETIKLLAEKYGKDEGQIVLRWHFDTGSIPVFTTTKKTRIESYTNINDFHLTENEISAINGMNINYKMYLESVACPGF